MIEKLTFGEPFFKTEYIEDETEYVTGAHTLIFNMSKTSVITYGVKELAPYSAGMFSGETVCIADRAVAIINFGEMTEVDDDTADAIKKCWKSVWELTHAPRNIGVEYYKCETAYVGGDTTMNFCLGEAGVPGGLHKTHGDRDFDEFHLQLCGDGQVELFSANDAGTRYEVIPLMPGIANAPVWDESGEYPWHRYFAHTRCIFLVIEIDR